MSARPHASQPGGRRGPEGAAAAAGSGGAGGGDPPGSAAAPLWSFLRRRALEPVRGGGRGRPRGRRLPERPGPAREVSGLPERVAGPAGERRGGPGESAAETRGAGAPRTGAGRGVAEAAAPPRGPGARACVRGGGGGEGRGGSGRAPLCPRDAHVTRGEAG